MLLKVIVFWKLFVLLVFLVLMMLIGIVSRLCMCCVVVSEFWSMRLILFSLWIGLYIIIR